MATTLTTSYNGTSGLGAGIFVEIRDAVTGAVLVTRTNTGIRQDVTPSGDYIYVATGLPDTAWYEATWDENDGSYYSEVIATPIVVNSAGSGGGSSGGGDTFPTSSVGPLSLDYGVTGRAASLKIKVVNSVTGVTVYAASGTGITEVETGLYTKASFTYPASIGTYRSAWYDGGVYIAGSADEWRVTPATTASLVTTAGGSSTSTLSFLIKRGDTDPSVSVQCLVPNPNDATGASMIPWPIPESSTVKFTMRDVGDFSGRTRTSFPAGAPKVHADASVDDATNGVLSYGWATGDTDTDGTYRGEFEVTTLGGEIRTFPTGTADARNWIAITITDDLDPGITP